MSLEGVRVVGRAHLSEPEFVPKADGLPDNIEGVRTLQPTDFVNICEIKLCALNLCDVKV